MKNITVVDSEIETAYVRKFVTAREIKFATNERCWRPTKSKYLNQKIYFTRQRKRLFEQRLSLNYCFVRQFENLKRDLIKDILELGYTDIPFQDF